MTTFGRAVFLYSSIVIMDSISLSANWMWPCRSQEGEDARLYTAVKALSDFCCALQINVPTGKVGVCLVTSGPGATNIITGLAAVSYTHLDVYKRQEKHLPNAVLLPMVRHSRHFKILKYQIEAGKPLQKRL